MPAFPISAGVPIAVTKTPNDYVVSTTIEFPPFALGYVPGSRCKFASDPLENLLGVGVWEECAQQNNAAGCGSHSGKLAI